MTQKEREILVAIRDLASLQVETMRRMGAGYGSVDDWHRDVTAAVKIMEWANSEGKL